MNRGTKIQNNNPADGRYKWLATTVTQDPETGLWLVKYDRDGSHGWVSPMHLGAVDESGNRAFFTTNDGEDCR